MNHNKDEKQLIEIYARHIFEDRQDNLEVIKRQIVPDDVSRAKIQALFFRARICSILSVLTALMSFGIYGGYRYLIFNTSKGSWYVGSTLVDNNSVNIQSPEMIGKIQLIIAILLCISLVLFIASRILKKNIKKFKIMQQKPTSS